MTQNIEQRTEVAVKKYEGAATSVDQLAHTDKDVETAVGPRKSFPKISREWDDESQRLQTEWKNDSGVIREDWKNERNELSTKALGVKPWETGQSETNINQQRRWTDNHTYLPKSVPAVMGAAGPDDYWIPYTADKSDTLNDVFGRKPIDLVNGVVLIPDTRKQYPKLNAFGKMWELDDNDQQLTVKSFTESVYNHLIITLDDDSQVIANKMEGASRTWVSVSSEKRQKALSDGQKQLEITTGKWGQIADGIDRVYFNEDTYWYAWDEPQGTVTNFVDNNDYGTATLTTTTGSYEFVKPDIYNKRRDFWPSAWGVKADGITDDWLGWHRLMNYYKTKVIVHVEPGMTPLASIPMMKGVVGKTLLSKPLELYGYLKADFDLTQFARHPDWNQEPNTYLLTSKDMYQSDFGGLSVYNEDYALNVENKNLDNGLISVKNLRFSKCNHALRSFCQSSNVEYSDFRFDNCKRMVDIVRGDKVIFRRGNMYQAVLTEQWDCSVDNRNAKLVFRDVLGVPAKNTGSEVAWVNNSDGGRVDFSGFRAGGENGGGCALLNNFAKFKLPTDIDPTPVSIKVNNNDLYSVDIQGGTQKSCIIRLFEMPNVLHYIGNEGMVMTEEVITFGKSVSKPTSLVDEVIERLSNFSFRYNHNCHDREVKKYADELIDLFMPSDTIPLVAKPSGTDGLANCETRIKPIQSSIYEINITGQVHPSGSVYYESSFRCILTIGTQYENGKVVRKATVTEVAKSPGGAIGDRQITADARFWNGATQSESADITDDLWRLRIQVAGFEQGHEGAGFKGTIKQLL